MTIIIIYQLIIITACILLLHLERVVCNHPLLLCVFSELVPAYDSSTFVLVNFR